MGTASFGKVRPLVGTSGPRMLAPAAAPVNPRRWRHPGDNGRMNVPKPRESVPEAALAEAVESLRRGELVALPTETVYGLGADATNP